MVKDVEGKLTVQTDNGNVEAVGISGTLNIESGHGDLQVDGILLRSASALARAISPPK